jgi:hypothetical protein
MPRIFLVVPVLLITINVPLSSAFLAPLPAFHDRTWLTTTTPSRPAAFILKQADKDDGFVGEENQDFDFAFEPDDTELAKLGEELGDLDNLSEDVLVEELGEEEAEEEGDDDIVIVNFDEMDETAEEEEEEEDDEVDIKFDDEEDEEILVALGLPDEDAYQEEEYDDEEEEEADYEYYDDEEDEYQEDGWEDMEMSGDEEDEYDYELEDDDDPNYIIQKGLVETNSARLDARDQERIERERNWADLTSALEADEDTFEDYKFISKFDTEAVERGEDIIELEWSDSIAEKVKELMDPSNKYITVSEDDVLEMDDRFEGDPSDSYLAAQREVDADLEHVEEQRKTRGAVIEELESLISTKYDANTPRSRIMNVNHVAEIGMQGVDAFSHIPQHLIDEIKDCMTEMGSASYNVTKWLVYDLDFNVTNLMLAAVQHSPKAPILFEHWLPQLQVCERYQYARDRNFSFTWDDVNVADMEELKVYYRGFGYNEIPQKAPSETGIINLEELDQDELAMADFAAWCNEVYNPEWDRKDFDDDDIQDTDNVYSPNFVLPQHPDLPAYEDAKEDVRNWYGEIEMMNDGDVNEQQAEYRDMVGKEYEYKFINDEEFNKAFRGHLIIACPGDEADLDVAEKITVRFEEEFGKQVFVETRVISHALSEDNVFEIWLESYDIELLHSKKRASTGAKDWTGPADCDDAEIDRLVERVAYLISDDARYSYRMDMGVILN